MTRASLRRLGGATAVVLALLPLSGPAAPTRSVRQPERIPDFALLDEAGRHHQLSRYATARAVVLYWHWVGCAATDADLAALDAVRQGVADPRVAYLVIETGPTSGATDLRGVARPDGDIPILRDEGQIVAEALHVRHAGEAMVIDPGTREVAYRGPIGAAGRNLLAEAVRSLLDGGPVSVEAPPVVGCALPRGNGAQGGAVSYAREIVPLLRAKCMACHRPAGVAPWAMESHERVKVWGPLIRQAVLTGRMPPWHADPRFGRFTGDRSLSVEEKRLLLRWIDAGAPRDPGPDPLGAPLPSSGEEWPLGKPDAIVKLPVQEIPTSGVLPYRDIRVPAPVAGDRWVRAVHVKPTDGAVVHHYLVFLEYPARWRARQPEWQAGAGSFFAVYAPGYPVSPFPVDSGVFLPAGTTIHFQVHYTPIGRATTDVPTLALYYHARPPRREYRISNAGSFTFVIPPGAPDHEVRARGVFDRRVVLHGLMPHMHYRGKRFRYEARYPPDGRVEVLLSVPHYDFNWQTQYNLTTPKPLPAGTLIEVTGAFDNSVQNPANPDPAQEVRYGLQSTDEMFMGYVMYTVPVGTPRVAWPIGPPHTHP